MSAIRAKALDKHSRDRANAPDDADAVLTVYVPWDATEAEIGAAGYRALTEIRERYLDDLDLQQIALSEQLHDLEASRASAKRGTE